MERGTLLVVKGKGNQKSEYVPLGKLLVKGMKAYLESEQPQTYLFMGVLTTTELSNASFSQRGLQWVIKMLSKKAGITKDVNVHTLRHSSATHLLEDGLDIVTIKEPLRHANIETTMVYLHVAQSGHKKPLCPLDTLYNIQWGGGGGGGGGGGVES